MEGVSSTGALSSVLTGTCEHGTLSAFVVYTECLQIFAQVFAMLFFCAPACLCTGPLHISPRMTGDSRTRGGCFFGPCIKWQTKSRCRRRAVQQPRWCGRTASTSRREGVGPRGRDRRSTCAALLAATAVVTAALMSVLLVGVLSRLFPVRTFCSFVFIGAAAEFINAYERYARLGRYAPRTPPGREICVNPSA